MVSMRVTPTFRLPTTSIETFSSRSSTGDHASKPFAAAVRDGSGNAGHADPANAGPRSRPWTDHRSDHRAAFGRGAPGGTRIALSGSSPAQESRMDRVVLGHV